MPSEVSMTTLTRYVGDDLAILPDGPRREVIGGDVHMSTSPTLMYDSVV